MNQNFEKLVPILSNAFKVPTNQIQMESLLVEDLKADSLDASMALMEVEEQFGILVPERERTYRTVSDILAHIEELMQDRCGSTVPAMLPSDSTSSQFQEIHGI